MSRARWAGVVCLLAVVVFVFSFAAASSAQVSCTGVPAWKAGTAYAVGARVTYGGREYSCLQAHTAQTGWEPPNTPALWSDKGACSGTATPTSTPRPTSTTARSTATATHSPTATATKAATATATTSNTVLFHNTGTTAGWDTFTHEHYGSVTQVSSPTFKGSTALKVTQVYDSSYTGRYHSEAVHNDGYTPGQSRFYGFAFYLPSNWQFVSQTFNIAQFIADFSNTGCDDWMPTTMMWLDGTGLSTRVKSGTVCSQHITTYNNIAQVTAGAWHRVIIQASWKSDTTGFFKVWFDGVKVLEQYNIATTIADPQNRRYSFRVGMYANGWHDNGTMIGSQGTRTLYVDQVGIGGAFADADPFAW